MLVEYLVTDVDVFSTCTPESKQIEPQLQQPLARERRPTSMLRSCLRPARLFALHSWLGLFCGLWLSIICLSGAIAVFSNELDHLFDPALQASALQRADVNWQAVHVGLSEKLPYIDAPYISGPRHAGYAVQALGVTAGGTSVKIYVDPHSGSVQAVRNFFDVQRFFRSFHRNLFNGSVGIFVVTNFAWFLLITTITALCFLPRWWRGMFTWRHSQRQPWLKRIKESHRLVGLWTLPIAGIIVVTGIWYQIELKASFSEPRQEFAPQRNARLAAVQTQFDRSDLARSAESLLDDFSVTQMIDNGPLRPITFTGDRNWWARQRANAVQFDPLSGEVLGLIRAEDLGVHGIISNGADPLHFGTFGGLWTQTLWFICGIGLAALPLTGGVLWYRRHLAKGKRSALTGAQRFALRSVPVISIVGFIWIGWGALRSADVWSVDDSSSRVVCSHEQLSIGPWQASLLGLHAATLPGTDTRSNVETNAQAQVTAKSTLNITNTQRIGVHFSATTGSPLVTSVSWQVGEQTVLAKQRGTLWWADLGASTAPVTLLVSGPAEQAYRQSIVVEDFLGIGKTIAVDGAPPVMTYVWWVCGSFLVFTIGIMLLWLRFLH